MEKIGKIIEMDKSPILPTRRRAPWLEEKFSRYIRILVTTGYLFWLFLTCARLYLNSNVYGKNRII